MNQEQLRLRRDAEDIIARLTQTRTQIAELERRSTAAQAEIYRADNVERFLGRLEQAITLYERSGEDAELSASVNTLKEQISSLHAIVSEPLIQERTRASLSTVETIAGQIIPTLDAEWPDAPIRLVIKDLTIKIVQGSRDDHLWEIGSGANWLAYHISVSLALQRFFLRTPSHPVPGFIVYDQPSQVYFPKGVYAEEVEPDDWRDEDREAVTKVFSAMSNETLRAKGNLQVIVLDHADDSVWGGIENTVLVEEWRDGTKLVPMNWIPGEAGTEGS